MLLEAMQCGSQLQTRILYQRTYPQIFNFVNYSPVIGMLGKVMSYIIISTWSYRDLFIINISLTLTAAFRQINKELTETKGHVMNPAFYWRYRKVYSKLRALIYDFDDSINTIIMLALAKNIFIICAHLFNTV